MKLYLILSSFPAVILPTLLLWYASQVTHSTFNSCATFLTTKSCAEKVSVLLNSLSITSVHDSSANSATLSVFLDNSFLKDNATTLLWRNILSVNWILKDWCFYLFFNTELSLKKMTTWTSLGLSVMIIFFFLKVFHESIPFRLIILLQARRSKNFDSILFANYI